MLCWHAVVLWYAFAGILQLAAALVPLACVRYGGCEITAQAPIDSLNTRAAPALQRSVEGRVEKA